MKDTVRADSEMSLQMFFAVEIMGLNKEFEAMKNYQKTIEQLNEEITKAKNNYDLNRVANIKYEQIPGLVNEIEIIKSRIRVRLKKTTIQLMEKI